MKEALVFYNRRDYKRALNELLKQDVDENQYFILSYYLGLCYMRLEKYNEAMLYFEQVEGSKSKVIIFRSKLLIAYIYILNNQFNVAERELKKLIIIGYQNSLIYTSLGHVLFKQNKNKEALSVLEKSLKLDPKNLNIINSINFIKVESSADKEILKACLKKTKKIIEIDQRNAAFKDTLGWIYYKLGQKNKAFKNLREALNHSPNNPEILDHLKKIKEN